MFGKFIVSFNKVKIKTMDKKTIDQFFDSLSEDVLKEKWNKYDEYLNKRIQLRFLNY